MDTIEDTAAETETHEKRQGGFAVMSSEERRRIASMGGKARAALGVGQRWTKETASAAGRKGGAARRRNAAERMASAPAGGES